MKKTLTAIIAASILTFGGIAHCCEGIKDTSKEYTQCVEKYKDLVPGKDYAKGYIVVMFDKGVTGEEADKFIESCDANNELKMADYFEGLNISLVTVPEGKEIDYVCSFNILGDETIVYFAEPDYLARILN